MWCCHLYRNRRKSSQGATEPEVEANRTRALAGEAAFRQHCSSAHLKLLMMGNLLVRGFCHSRKMHIKIFLNKGNRCQMWWHTSFFPALRRQSQENLEFEVSLVHLVESCLRTKPPMVKGDFLFKCVLLETVMYIQGGGARL